MEPNAWHSVRQPPDRQPFPILHGQRVERPKHGIECARAEGDEREEPVEIAPRFESEQRGGLLHEAAYVRRQETQIPLALHFGTHLRQPRHHVAGGAVDRGLGGADLLDALGARRSLDRGHRVPLSVPGQQ